MMRRLIAEGVGTAFLLIAVVGSGIMAETLSGGNTGVALLANAIATGCALYVLITIFGPVSGAHLNPGVSIAFLLRGEMPIAPALSYIATQISAAILGVWIAHLMFDLSVFQFSDTQRTGPGQWLAEAVATFGLVLTIFGGLRHRPDAVSTIWRPYAGSAVARLGQTPE